MMESADSRFTRRRKKQEFLFLNSSLEVKCNLTLLYLIGVLGFTIIELLNIRALTPLVGLIVSKYYLPIADDTTQKTMTIFNIFFGLIKMGYLTVPNIVFWAMYDQRIMHPRAEKHVKLLLAWVKLNLDAMTPYASPVLGVNSGGLAEEIINTVHEKVSEFAEYVIHGDYLQFDVRAAFLRKIEVNTNTIDLADRPHITGSDFLARVKIVESRQRIGIFAAIILFVAFVVRQPLLLTVVLAYLVNKHLEVKTTNRRSKKRTTVEEGVYLVTNNFFGFGLSHGIGIAHSGVLHVPYHVSRAQPVYLGNSILHPYHVSIDDDVVTYGGPPCFVRPKDGQRVFVNTETVDATVTYSLVVEKDDADNTFAWAGVTRPGESGSPVFGLKEDSTIELYGLAGRYYKDSDGVTEFASLPAITTKESNIELGKVERIILGPGKGKTTRIMPASIAKYLKANANKKVLVAGPTRAVCREIDKSLSPKFRTSINIKGERIRDPRAPVQIASHHTALAMLMSGDRCLNNLGFIILDEAHMRDYSTKSLRRYLTYFVDNGGKALELSATLDGICDKASNYPILDSSFKNGELEGLLEELVNEGKRSLVFVKSAKSDEVRSLMKKFKGSLALSRETYQNTIEMVNNEEVKLIFTTNISECGLNITNLDAVVDTCVEFTYVEEGGVISPKSRYISQASAVQRRGRVGRFKPGAYYYLDKWTPIGDEVTADDIEADVLCSGREWAHGVGNKFNIILSDWQVSKALENMLSPIEAYLRFDHQGRSRDKKSLGLLLKKLRQGDVDYRGCGRDDCPCAGNWIWFDERLHDLITGGAMSKVLYE